MGVEEKAKVFFFFFAFLESWLFFRCLITQLRYVHCITDEEQQQRSFQFLKTKRKIAEVQTRASQNLPS